MSRCFIILALACCGCKTAEVAVVHPATGVQVVAKFESFEPREDRQRAIPPAIGVGSLDGLGDEPFVVR